MKICVLCGRWFSYQFEIVLEIQLALRWIELYFDRCCALKPTGTFACERKVMCLSTDFETWCFDVWHSRHQSVCQQLFWDWEKLNLINELIPINVLLIGFVKLEINKWFSAHQDQFCAWLSLARLPTARIIFSEPFSKKETAVSFFSRYTMLLVPVQCLDSIFLYLTFAQSCKIWSKFSELSAILKHRGKNFVMMTSIVHLSSSRS